MPGSASGGIGADFPLLDRKATHAQALGEGPIRTRRPDGEHAALVNEVVLRSQACLASSRKERGEADEALLREVADKVSRAVEDP